MIGAPNGSKLIVTVLIHAHSPQTFAEARERELCRLYTTAATRERYREHYDVFRSPVHRYNDVAGYAEVYWDAGTRILLDFFFKGDMRTTFGKAIAKHYPEGTRLS